MKFVPNHLCDTGLLCQVIVIGSQVRDFACVICIQSMNNLAVV